jgi:hypothetical protein
MMKLSAVVIIVFNFFVPSISDMVSLISSMAFSWLLVSSKIFRDPSNMYNSLLSVYWG